MSLRNALALSAVIGFLIATPSQAEVYEFTLTANPAAGTYSTGGGNAIYELNLPTIDSFTLNAGDQIHLNLTLDSQFIVPAGTPQFFGVNLLTATDPEIVDTGLGVANGSILFANYGGSYPNPVSSGCGNCLSNIIGADGPAFTFSGLVLESTYDNFSNPITVTGLSISYQVTIAEAVPEPSTWAMMILGFAGVGFMTYRRRKTAALAA
jgi:hypothetical protein